MNKDNLKSGFVVVAMYDTKKKKKIVVRGESLYYRDYGGEKKEWLLGYEYYRHGLNFDNEDGTITRWTLSRTSFENVVAIMFESDMLKDLEV